MTMIPICIGCISTILKLNFNGMGSIMTMSACWSGAINPLATMFLVAPYRRYISNKIRRVFPKNIVSSLSEARA